MEDMTHLYMRHVRHICTLVRVLWVPWRETWLIYMWDMFICKTWLIDMWDMWGTSACALYVPWHETWLVYTCDVTRLHAGHDSNTCETRHTCTSARSLCVPWRETWLIDRYEREKRKTMCVCHILARHDWLKCETWLIYMWDMNHLPVRHDSSMRETSEAYLYISICLMCAMTWERTDTYVRHNSSIYETWLIYIWDMTHVYFR